MEKEFWFTKIEPEELLEIPVPSSFDVWNSISTGIVTRMFKLFHDAYF